VIAAGFDRRATEQEVLAQINVLHFRALSSASSRWVALASLPLWLHAMWRVLPDFAAFLALSAEAACLLAAGVFAGLEALWRQRAARLESGPSTVRSSWTSWDGVRSALWQALALASLFPFSHVVLGRPFPRPLVSAGVASAAAVFLLLVAAETLPRLGPRGPAR
jgi:hypothetical protein